MTISLIPKLVTATTPDFGTLLYAGHDWADVDLAKNSMKLMAEKVMPKINKYTKIAAE